MDRRPSGLVQQGYWHPVQIGDGQDEIDTYREICHGRQWALIPWSKRGEGRERELQLLLPLITLLIPISLLILLPTLMQIASGSNIVVMFACEGYRGLQC